MTDSEETMQKNANHYTQGFQLPTEGWLRTSTKFDDPAERLVTIEVLGTPESEAAFLETHQDHLPNWQKKNFDAKDSEMILLHRADGPVYVLRAHLWKSKGDVPYGVLASQSMYSIARDRLGETLKKTDPFKPKQLHIKLHDTPSAVIEGAAAGLELAAYSYTQQTGTKSSKPLPKVFFDTDDSEALKRGIAIAEATNLARHLVNIPARELNPKTYADAIATLFASDETVSVHVWQPDELLEQGCHLLSTVGQAATEKARMVRIRYRPKGNTRWQRPLAIVGKGITYDTGGLNVKPPPSMRRMKKDMGGSAAATGFAYWLTRSQFNGPCDIYLCLADNAISSESFRPGDVITAKNGLKVEIDNTDAEGRLALADGLMMAESETGQDTPFALIDLATLTGAARVALGTDLAALFSTHEELARTIQEASATSGDPVWEMPLYTAYGKMLRSHVGDMLNSSASGFAGCITAALFLRRFVEKTPWAHIDLYAWTDETNRYYRERGGSGQGVQCMIHAVQQLEEIKDKADANHS